MIVQPPGFLRAVRDLCTKHDVLLICDEVAVMYAGEIVEHAPVEALFRVPQHPYTIGLLASIPRLDRRVETLATIEGSLPDMSEIPLGCRFAPRCPFASDICIGGAPPVVSVFFSFAGFWEASRTLFGAPAESMAEGFKPRRLQSSLPTLSWPLPAFLDPAAAGRRLGSGWSSRSRSGR
jgi:oligopeptide/dipeptide ABC transporter ATP-binding protein